MANPFDQFAADFQAALPPGAPGSAPPPAPTNDGNPFSFGDAPVPAPPPASKQPVMNSPPQPMMGNNGYGGGPQMNGMMNGGGGYGGGQQMNGMMNGGGGYGGGQQGQMYGMDQQQQQQYGMAPNMGGGPPQNMGMGMGMGGGPPQQNMNMGGGPPSTMGGGPQSYSQPGMNDGGYGAGGSAAPPDSQNPYGAPAPGMPPAPPVDSNNPWGAPPSSSDAGSSALVPAPASNPYAGYGAPPPGQQDQQQYGIPGQDQQSQFGGPPPAGGNDPFSSYGAGAPPPGGPPPSADPFGGYGAPQQPGPPAPQLNGPYGGGSVAPPQDDGNPFGAPSQGIYGGGGSVAPPPSAQPPSGYGAPPPGQGGPDPFGGYGAPPSGAPPPNQDPFGGYGAPPPGQPPVPGGDTWGLPVDPAQGAIVPSTGPAQPYGGQMQPQGYQQQPPPPATDPFSVFNSSTPAPVPNAGAIVPAHAPPQQQLQAAPLPAGDDDLWSDMGFDPPPSKAPAPATQERTNQDGGGRGDADRGPSSSGGGEVELDDEGLPSGGEFYDARIFTPTLGVMFFKPQELTDSLFLNTERSLVDNLHDRPVVAFIVEGSSARSAGVELGHVLLKVNGVSVNNPKEASRLIKEGPRPLPLLFYVPATDVVVAEGEHMVKYDTRETTAPGSAKDWKPKYVVIGGIIAQPWMINMYRSKSEYDIAVIETQARRPVSVKVKQFSLQGARIQNDWQGPQMVKYKNKLHPWKYIVILPVARNPIKISSPNLSHLKPVHEGIRRVLLAQQRDRGGGRSSSSRADRGYSAQQHEHDGGGQNGGYDRGGPSSYEEQQQRQLQQYQQHQQQQHQQHQQYAQQQQYNQQYAGF